jgi:hypothetical protein
MKRLLGGILLGGSLAIVANVLLLGSLLTSGHVEVVLFAGAGVALLVALISLGVTAAAKAPRRRSAMHPAGRARIHSAA